MVLSSSFRRFAAGAGAGLLATGLLALAPAAAGAAATPVVGSGSGLTAPTGIAKTPDGATWVSDDANGVCRVTRDSSPAVAFDSWCGAAHAGPIKATGLAFHAASSSFYVGDGASQGGAIWRLKWDAATGTIAGGSPVARFGQSRVSALTLVPSPDGLPAHILFATKDSTAVMRFAAPAGAGLPDAPVAIAHAAQPGPGAIAQLDARLYLAEGSDVTAVDLAAGGPAERVQGLAGGAPSALAADPARGRLYVGTANNLDDAVNVLETATGALALYERGFAGVTALAVEADGDVLVADDPGEAAGVLDAADHGRLWRIPLRSVHRPSVRVDVAPAGVSASPDAHFAYSSAADSTFECRLDGAGWSTCPGTGSGEISYAGLSDGVHVFELRAVNPDPDIGAGVPARRVFVVDTRAPRAWIVGGEAAEVVDGRPVALELLADEFGVDFTCSRDGGPLEPCDASVVLEGLALGEHDFRIRGMDAAGNVSDPDAPAAHRRWITVPRPVEPSPVTPPGEPVRVEPAAPAAPAAPPAAAQLAAPAPTPHGDSTRASRDTRTASARRSSRVARLTLVTKRLARPRAGRRARAIVIRFDAPSDARTVRVTLDAGERRIASRRLPVRGGANRVLLRLTTAQSRRLRRGNHRLVVELTDDAGRPGRAYQLRLRVV